MAARHRWPPVLEDHQLLSSWRELPPTELERIRAIVGPCEALECAARVRDTGVREFVLALRPAEARS